MNPSQSDYAPIESFQRALARWWLVALLFLAGALAGWLVSLLEPPVYEARAGVLTTVDFSAMGPLVQFEEDLMMDAVGNLLQSAEVIDRVTARAAQENILTLDRPGFVKIATIERRLGIWELRVRHTSPEVAQSLANVWLEEGQAVLQDAYQHAETAGSLLRYSRSLEACLEASSISETSSVLCSQDGMDDLQLEMAQTAASLAEERAASRGLITGVLLGPPQPALLPDRPVYGSRSIFLAAGGLVGLLAGFALAQARIRLRGREL